MASLTFVALWACALIPLAASGSLAPVGRYGGCQSKTADPLQGCPRGTIYVSQTDTRATFKTIQGAISSLPNNTTPYVILIAPGIYTEQLNVTRPGPLTLLGMSDEPGKRGRYADIAHDTDHQNDVQVYWNSANTAGRFDDNVWTGVLTIGPTLNATYTGRGPTGNPVPPDTPFGCADFRAYNIDFRNEQFPYSNGPAHALGVSRANAGFYSCGFYSWQDTIYIGKLGNAYFYDTVVAGQTDFLYGFGTLWIEKSTLSLRSCGGGIIAWKGTNTTFANKYGAYIANSRILAANDTIAPKIKDKCSLGRPWNALHRSVIMDSYFDDSILPAGYTDWSGTNFGVNTTMAVYNDSGPGYDAAAEEASNITTVLDQKGVQPYRSPRDVFRTPDGSRVDVRWIDNKCGL